jgi:adenine-specific DNA-methyltransferase
MIISKDEKYDLKYILAILNSKLAVDWFFRKGKRRGAGVDIGVEKLRSFPIKIPSDDEQHELVELVDSLMEITSRANYDPTKPSRQQMKLENMCDQMVNKLYRLTGEDIETLEAAQWT